MMNLTTLDRRMVTVAEIDPEPVFRLTWGFQSDRLKMSLEAVGLQNPLVLWRQEGRFRILCGYRRYTCLTELGQTDLWAVILPADVSPRQALILALEENLGHRGFNDAEKVLAVEALSRYFTPEEIVSGYLKKLDIPPKPEFYQRFLRLAGLGPSGLDALAEGILDPDLGEKLAGMDPADREAVLSLIQTLKPGRNRRREIWEWLDEISRREKRTLADILQDDAIQIWLNDPKVNRPQKETGLRKALRYRRFPRLTELEQKQKDRLRALALPDQIRLTCPPNFEGLDFTVEISFSDMDGFRRGVACLKQLENSKDLEELVLLG